MKTRILAITITLLAVPFLGQASKVHRGAGEGVFQELCVGCHGPDGRAQTEMGRKVGAADLTSAAIQQQSNSMLSKIVKDGKGKMPAFDGKLGDEEINAVITYIRRLARNNN